MRRGAIELFTYWHVGSGRGRGADLDAVVLKDEDGLPFIPGKEIKGLFREAVRTLEENGHATAGMTDQLFGKEATIDDDASSRPGLLRFTNATLIDPERTWLVSKAGKKYTGGLYEAIASTSLDNQGVALDKTLRTIEVTVPVNLQFEIDGQDESSWLRTVAQAAKLVRNLGAGRHRGLGRCRIQIL